MDIKAKEAAWYGNTVAANFKTLHAHFTKSADRVKAEFIRLAVWLQMAWGE